MKRTAFTISSLVLAVLLLAACATPTPQVIRETVIVQATPEVVEKEVTTVVEVEKVVTATPEPLPEDAKIILRVGTGDSGEGLNPHQEIIARFEEANPDILVQLEAVSGRDYYTRLLTQIAAGDAPDIMQIGDDAVPMFVGKWSFLALDGFIAGTYALDTGI